MVCLRYSYTHYATDIFVQTKQYHLLSFSVLNTQQILVEVASIKKRQYQLGLNEKPMDTSFICQLYINPKRWDSTKYLPLIYILFIKFDFRENKICKRNQIAGIQMRLKHIPTGKIRWKGENSENTEMKNARLNKISIISEFVQYHYVVIFPHRFFLAIFRSISSLKPQLKPLPPNSYLLAPNCSSLSFSYYSEKAIFVKYTSKLVLVSSVRLDCCCGCLGRKKKI